MQFNKFGDTEYADNKLNQIADKLKLITDEHNTIEANDIIELINSSNILNENNNKILKLFKNQIDYLKEDHHNQEEYINKQNNKIDNLNTELKKSISESQSEQEFLNKQINDYMISNSHLNEKNKDIIIKTLSKEAEYKQKNKDYEKKIKQLSQELTKSQTQNKILSEELTKSQTQIKQLSEELIKSQISTSSDYVDLEKKLLENNNDIINLNSDNIKIFEKTNKTSKKNNRTNEIFFKDEIHKQQIKDNNNNNPTDIIINEKPNVSYSTDYMISILKNTDKINNSCLNVIIEDDENDTLPYIKHKNSNKIIGGFIPSTNNNPKNHIYDIDGKKKMNINDEFTTLTEQGDYNTKTKHLAYTRKTRRKNKKSIID